MLTNDTTMEDQQILNLIRQGGKMRDQGVAAFYREYAIHLSNFLIGQAWKKWKLKLNRDDAEEIVQETYIKVVRHCENFKGDSTVKTWLFSIGIHCMIDHLDRIKRRPSKNLDDEGWDALVQERQSKPRPDLYAGTSLNPDMHTSDSPPSNETLEDCVGRGFAEFAQKFSERALVLSLVMEGFDTAHIAAAIQRTPGATREFISQSRKRIEEFLLPCKEYLSTV